MINTFSMFFSFFHRGIFPGKINIFAIPLSSSLDNLFPFYIFFYIAYKDDRGGRFYLA